MKKALFPLVAVVLVLGLAVTLVGPVSGTIEGQLEILKLDENGDKLYGATFVISPNPKEGGTGDLTVVDNGMNDDDPQDGVLLVTDCKMDPEQKYTVTETVAPPGYQAAPPQSGIKIPSPDKVTLTFVNRTTRVGGEVHPINRVGILAPWLGLALLLIGGLIWFGLRRRST